jgi:hypothetical protein
MTEVDNNRLLRRVRSGAWSASDMSKDSARLRDLAARSFREGRASSDPIFRLTCFGVAAAYKRFALGEEMLGGGPLRSLCRPSVERRPRVSGLV